jgi:transforming growth factor-beta-induced protein
LDALKSGLINLAPKSRNLYPNVKAARTQEQSTFVTQNSMTEFIPKQVLTTQEAAQMFTKITYIATIALLSASASASPKPLDIDFEEGVNAWRVVLDGVMGGRSSGRVLESESGVLEFNGNLSLENNGGFSQIRTNIDEGSLTNQEGLEIRFMGDGRTYQFDIRVSNVRLMAGGFQTTFETTAGQWESVRLPFDTFKLYTFGRKVPNAPALNPAMIESIGFTLADKNPGDFKLKIDSIHSYQSGSSETRIDGLDSDNSLESIASESGLNTLINLVSMSGLELPVGESVTIFAPSDAAFAKLPSDTIEFLTSPEGKETLQSILSYHIVPDNFRSDELLNVRTLKTLNGQTLKVETEHGPTVSGAQVSVFDTEFNGGLLHIVDAVLIPESRPIIELALQTESLSTLVTAIQAAGIEDQLSIENGPWTVFAPINSAFESLPDGVVEELLEPENRTELIELLGLHIVPGRISRNELIAIRKARTYFGNTVDFSVESGQLRVQGSNIVSADIETANGVVHLIDKVITEGKSSKPIQSESTPLQLNEQAVHVYELAISRGVPLFNNGQIQACASVYEVAIETIVALGSQSLDPMGIERLVMGLAEAESHSNPTQRAWIYRRALDEASERFRSR